MALFGKARGVYPKQTRSRSSSRVDSPNRFTYFQDMMKRSDTPGVIAPPPLIALATVALGLLLDWLWPAHALRDHFGLPARLIVGGALIGAGTALAIAAERTFHRIGTNAPPWKPALRLVTEGVYTHLRNPMYAGGLILLAGLGFALA